MTYMIYSTVATFLPMLLAKYSMTTFLPLCFALYLFHSLSFIYTAVVLISVSYARWQALFWYLNSND
jgi:hypothetical protein